MSSLNIDLHCHSNISDGVLSPTQLLARAAERSVNVLALTDHDDVSGLPEARVAAALHDIRLINGVEISVTWESNTLHIVGLGINPEALPLLTGLATIREGRKERAANIAAQLEKAGIHDALAGAWRHAMNPELIGRMHFARYMIEQGICADVQTVFKRFMTRGKPGYVPHQWAALTDAVDWIRASGGQAVLAHPGRYPLGTGKMRALLKYFSDAGGEGIEVVTSNHTPEQRARFTELAKQFGLLASRGSDFHSPGETWRDLGRLPALPPTCRPVWQNWNLN
jgi:predicted metal-dependent phosphoesterase TrpH